MAKKKKGQRDISAIIETILGVLKTCNCEEETSAREIFNALRTLLTSARWMSPGWSNACNRPLSECLFQICQSLELEEVLRRLSREDTAYLESRASFFWKPDVLDAVCTPEQVSIVWDFFLVIREDRGRLQLEASRKFVDVLQRHGEGDRALAVLDWMGQNSWTLDDCRKAIAFLIERKPMNLDRAQQIASDVGKSVVYVRSLDGSPGQYMKTSPEVESASEETRQEMMSYFASCLQERRWKDVQERYNSLRGHVLDLPPEEISVSVVEVENAMLEICKTYRKYENAWTIYGKMDGIDLRTLPIMAAICHQGYLVTKVNCMRHLEGDEQKDSPALVKLSIEKATWMERAWAVYQRYGSRPEFHSDNNLRFLVHELLWIMSYDANENENVLRKLDQLNGELLRLTGSPIADEYLARPAIKLCWGSVCDPDQDDEDDRASSKQASLAAEKAFELYQRIREKTVHGKYKRIRRCDVDVYIMLLELCVQAKDIGKMAYVCQDILDAKVELDEELIDAMQKVSSGYCSRYHPKEQGLLTIFSLLLL